MTSKKKYSLEVKKQKITDSYGTPWAELEEQGIGSLEWYLSKGYVIHYRVIPPAYMQERPHAWCGASAGNLFTQDPDYVSCGRCGKVTRHFK